MPAEVIRAMTVRDRRVITIEHEHVMYNLALKPARDFNGQFIGYVAWLRKHNELYLSEDEAVAAALLAVEGIARVAGETPVAAPAGA